MRKAFSHGLVIGKFYPPHLGHIYLIRTAAQYCHRVTVGVLASSVESIPLATRVSWLRECFAQWPHVRIVGEMDDLPIDYGDAEIWNGHVAIMRQAIVNANGQADIASQNAAPPVDAVFTSEFYGEELARHFNAANVCLDQARALYPISGTAARQDVVESWGMLPEPVRAGLAMRVVVLGAESTGTTTLSRDLVQALKERGGVWAHTQYVAEYGREFSANLQAIYRVTHPDAKPSDLDWEEEDFLFIAQEQTRQENTAAMRGSPVLVCDTDALATCIWHERYRASRSEALEQFVRKLPPRALYILTSHEGVEFEDDGLRDNSHLREGMTNRFREALVQQEKLDQTSWIELKGTREERLSDALQKIDEMLMSFYKFSKPFPEKNAV